MNRLRQAWAFASSALVGIFYSYKFEHPVNWNETYIICPNHTSNLDVAALCILVKNNFSFMGKQELEKGLVTSLFFKSVDIPVNRDSKMSSFRAFKKASEKLRLGITMIIFPEGTITDNYPPEIGEFKNGPFRLAIENKIPILPVTITNTWKVLWDTGFKYGSRPGVCNILVHEPISTQNLSINDTDALRDKVYQLIKNRFDACKANKNI